MIYDELIKRLRECTAEMNGEKTLWHQAADAIEELQKQLREEKVDNVNLTGWLAEEHAKLDKAEIENIKLKEEFAKYRGKNRWISVTERLPETHDYVLCCGAKGGMFVGYISCFTEPQGFAWAWQHGGQGRRIKWWMPLPEPPESEGE